MPISSVSTSTVRSVSPTVQPTAKSENASTNRTTPGTAEYPHAPQVDQARRGSLTITTVPTLATAALVGLSSLPVALGQSVNQQIATVTQQIATVTGITNVLLNATATNAEQTAANAAQIETLANLTAQIQDAANRAENAQARIEVIAGIALAVAAVIFIPKIPNAIRSIPNAIRAIPKAINSAISSISNFFSPRQIPSVALNQDLEAAAVERGSNHNSVSSIDSADNGRRIGAINPDASSHSSQHSSSDDEE